MATMYRYQLPVEQTGWMLHAWTQSGGCASHFIGL